MSDNEEDDKDKEEDKEDPSETDSVDSDEDFKSLVRKGKHHCKIGDVFQVVFSRRFEQSFTGDDLNVYRALRSLNPSPYLFYFDYGSATYLALLFVCTRFS